MGITDKITCVKAADAALFANPQGCMEGGPWEKQIQSISDAAAPCGCAYFSYASGSGRNCYLKFNSNTSNFPHRCEDRQTCIQSFSATKLMCKVISNAEVLV